MISVIIPTYNRSELIKRAIFSVLNQTYTDFEVIVVDDCSVDDTEKLVVSINDGRIRYIKLETKSGAPAARNVGIKLSKRPYISLLDSDDEYLPNKLELQINKIKELPENVGIVYCGYFILYEPDEIYTKVAPRHKGNLYNRLLRHNCMGSPTPLIKRECFDTCGLFDESLPSSQDWDMWIRISEKYHFDYIDEPLANVYTHGNQISTNINNKIISRERLFEKYKHLIIREPETASYLLQRLGFLYFLKNCSYTSLRYYLKSIAANPKDLETYMTLLTFLIAKKRHVNRMKHASIREANNITVYF